MFKSLWPRRSELTTSAPRRSELVKVSIVLQPGGVERVFFPLVLIVFGDFRPIQSAGPAPAVDNDSVLERLIPCSDYQAIALSRCSWLIGAPVKHERP